MYVCGEIGSFYMLSILIRILGKILELKFGQDIKAFNPWVVPLEMLTLVEALPDLIIFLKVWQALSCRQTPSQCF